jgi:hypothetical protein
MYSISYSVNNICSITRSLSFYWMEYLVINIFDGNTCSSMYPISYSVNNICNISTSLFYSI